MESIFHVGVLSPNFRKKEEIRMPFLHLLFQVPLAQNNSYSQVTYFEVAHSATLHYIILEFIVLAKGMMSGFRNLPLLLCIIPGSLTLVP